MKFRQDFLVSVLALVVLVSPATPDPSPQRRDPFQYWTPSGDMVFAVPSGCSCSSVNSYRPVCGSDGRAYVNRHILDCHNVCGIAVTFVRLGSCIARQLNGVVV